VWRVSIDPNGLEILDRAQCLALLATTSVGRIGVSMDALPAVLPMTFVLLGENIVIPTSIETAFAAAVDRNVVAFEADGRDATTGGVWSVMVRGIAHLADGTSYAGDPAFDRLPAWGPTALNRVVTMPTAVVTGRRSTGSAGYDDTIWRF
jgi:hypothetical protein